MDRRHYGDQSFFTRSVHGSSYYGNHRASEDDLVARSREWINRPDRDRGDPWRRSVDDFLDSKPGRYRRSRDRSRSRSRERDWDRKGRDRSRDREFRRRSPHDEGDNRYGDRRHRDYSSRKYSRENSEEKRPWSSGEEENSNSYKSEQDFDSDKSFMPGYTADGSLRPEDRFAYKRQSPQRTIIIRGMAQHITEVDIQDDISSCGLNCRDIRLVRRKDTGTSRGFAFVEFNTIEDATSWIELKQGELMLKDHFRALLQYSMPKDQPFMKGKWQSDWICKCQATNFRRRETCYMCNLSRKEGEVQEDTMEISTHPTNTVLLRGLDALTTEENVLHSIKTISSLPIKSVRIGRDAATGASRGVCYLEMNNVVDAMYLHNSLQSSVPVVDEKTPKISYAKLDPLTLHSSAAISGQIANAAVAAAQWSHQTTSSASEVSSSTSPAVFKASDVPRLAEYSASLYATNSQEKAAYLTYYEDYYKKQIADGQTISLPVNNASGLASAQANLTAHKKAQTTGPRTPLTEAPDGSGSCTYLPPDPTSFQYDSSSGYYYDPYTTLYYDATSHYYYNNKLQKFLYWDAAKETFLINPSGGKPSENQTVQMSAEEVLKDEEQKKGKEKEGEKDKVKVAKRIAKDMERWAKTLNQKKEIAKQNVVAQAIGMNNMRAAGAADIGYAVLERKDLPLASFVNGMDKPKITESLVAAYGQGSDSEDEDESAQEDKMHTDWVKNICLLCKRQFGNRDTLVKHQQMSDLHKQNLAAWYRSKGLDPDDAQHRSKQYRDRAKERRLKYGEPDKPLPSKLKESYIKAREAVVSYEEPTKAGIGSDNLGNKLLQKMGWSEGMGLGKSNQGRTSIIQAERRNATAGLGTKSVGVTPGPGETYKDCVKKMMAIRYSELTDPS